MKQNNLRKIEKEREAEKNSVFICVNDCMCVIYACANIEQRQL